MRQSGVIPSKTRSALPEDENQDDCEQNQEGDERDDEGAKPTSSLCVVSPALCAAANRLSDPRVQAALSVMFLVAPMSVPGAALAATTTSHGAAHGITPALQLKALQVGDAHFDKAH